MTTSWTLKGNAQKGRWKSNSTTLLWSCCRAALLTTSTVGTLNAVALATADEDMAMNDEIVVTGERRLNDYVADEASVGGFGNVAVKEIPQSVQVLTRDLIDDQGVLSLAELFGSVAGASPSLSRTTPFGTLLTQIRGQDAAIYRDGLRDIAFADIDSSSLTNVERVEIIKGPAGVVYGTDGPGGTVNIVTKRPTEDFLLQLRGTLGTRGTRIIESDVSLPLGSGFGLRVTSEFERSDSFIDFSEIERDNVSANVTYDNGGPLTGSVVFERHANRDDNAMTRVGLPALGTIIDAPGVEIRRNLYLGEPASDFTDSNGTMTTAKVEYAFNDNISFEAAGRRAIINFDQSEVRTLGPLDLETLTVPRSRGLGLDLREEQYLARGRVRVRGDIGKTSHDLSFGYEFFSFDLFIGLDSVPNALVPPISVVNPVYLNDGILGETIPIRITRLDTTHEIFAQDVVRLGDMTITGGVRHVWANFSGGTEDLQETTYQIGGTYALTDQVSIFSGYNTGFDANSGIAADRSRTGERFDPETFRQFEAGIKTDLFADVTATLAYFRLTRDGILVDDPLDAAFSIQAGRERSEGFEADLVWAPSENFQARAGYAYLDAKIVSDTDPSLIGRARPRAPENQFNAFASYTFTDGPLKNLRLNGGVTFIDEAFASVTNSVVRPSYTLANFSGSYTFKKLRFDAILTNAFDEEYVIARNDVQVNAGEPRLFTARVTWRY